MELKVGDKVLVQGASVTNATVESVIMIARGFLYVSAPKPVFSRRFRLHDLSSADKGVDLRIEKLP